MTTYVWSWDEVVVAIVLVAYGAWIGTMIRRVWVARRDLDRRREARRDDRVVPFDRNRSGRGDG